MGVEQIRTYDRSESVVFLKTNDAFGGLSNMAGGFSLYVQGVRILTAEALYQACRFPHLPEVQRLIIGQNSPMTAKMKSKPYRKDSRPDWDRVRTKIMRWCLRVKLAQNWVGFSELLLETGDRPIVEESRKDDFWGAKPMDDGVLVGMNVLGRLLMELREAIKSEGRERLLAVEPLAISDFFLFGKPIGVVYEQDGMSGKPSGSPVDDSASGYKGVQPQAQPSLFDVPTVKEAVPVDYLRKAIDGVRIADLKPYSEYQSTGHEWLGSVPAHWRRLPGRACFVKKNKSNWGLLEKTVLSLSYGRIVVKPVEKLHGLVPESFETYQIIEPGDIVVRPTDLQNDWNSLRLGFARNRGIITSAYLCFGVKDKLLPEYGHLLLHTYDLMKVFYGLGSGLRQNLDWGDFKYLPCLPPPLEEQAAIVRFLDWANGRLERTIRAKRKVIALLNEQKQAIIHRAVTRGLDPSVPLKPSGIPWLGDIPRHWETLALKRVLRRLIDCEHKTAPRVNQSDFRVIRTTGIRNGILRMHGTYCTTFHAFQEWTRRSLPEPGDVIFTREAPAGEACIVPNDINLCLGQRTVLMKIDTQRLSPQYLVHTIYAGPPRIAISLASQGSTVGHFNMSDIGALAIFLPPKDEQEKIVVSILNQTSGLEATIFRLEREIELLREYHTRLVSDVVTGKLDVRDVASQLPDESPNEVTEGDVDLIDEIESADEEAAA